MSSDAEWEERSKRPGMPKKKNTPTANDRESGTRDKRRTTSTNYQTDRRNQARSSGRNATKEPYVYPGFDPSSVIRNVPNPDPGKGKKKKKKKKKEEDGAAPAKVLPAVVTSSAVGGQVNPNVFDAYIAEIRRLTLRLVNNAKNLL
jgi:hypothetical protein